jgi:hypothetical protein
MQNPAAEQATKAIKDANNVLVTVRNNPSVDELSAAIALTLMLNKLNKHAVTVFSGRVPSTIEFLQPEMAIDTNTDSLRDFIIALDKSKADKLRYKVEDNVVRIFITPYKTSITEKDLEFSQGDFNVDVVVALGVVNKEDFDQAVTTHGRILHDATVVTLTKHDIQSQIGAINWQDQAASSVSEMITSISDGLGENLLDGQTATALLTGIVSETDRFRNSNTTPQVMSLSSKLMAAGANQQLIAEKLEETDVNPDDMPKVAEDGSAGALEITHNDENGESVSKIHIDDSGNLELPVADGVDDDSKSIDENEFSGRGYLESPVPPTLFAKDESGNVSEQPLLGGDEHKLASQFDDSNNGPATFGDRKVVNPLPVNEDNQAGDSNNVEQPTAEEVGGLDDKENTSSVAIEEPKDASIEVDDKQTLSELEKAVESSTAVEEQPASAPTVEDFLGSTRLPTDSTQPTPTELPAADPIATTVEPQNAQELDSNRNSSPVENQDQPVSEPKLPDSLPTPSPQVDNSNAPPAVPPPLMPQATTQPQFFEPDGTNSNPFLNPS